MSPRTTGMSAFSLRMASAKSASRPICTRTPGNFWRASPSRSATSSGAGGPWLSPVWMSQPGPVGPAGWWSQSRAIATARVECQQA